MQQFFCMIIQRIFFYQAAHPKKGRKKTLNACTLYTYTKRYIGFQSMKDKNPAQFIAKNVTFFLSLVSFAKK